MCSFQELDACIWSLLGCFHFVSVFIERWKSGEESGGKWLMRLSVHFQKIFYGRKETNTDTLIVITSTKNLRKISIMNFFSCLGIRFTSVLCGKRVVWRLCVLHASNNDEH